MTGRLTRRVVIYLLFFVLWALLTLAGAYGFLYGHKPDKVWNAYLSSCAVWLAFVRWRP